MRGQEDAIPDWDGVMGKLFFRGFKFIIGLFFMSLIGYVFNLLVAHYSVFLLSLNSVYSFMLVVILGIFVCFYVLFMLPALVMVFCEQDKFFSLFNFQNYLVVGLKHNADRKLEVVHCQIIDNGVGVTKAVILLLSCAERSGVTSIDNNFRKLERHTARKTEPRVFHLDILQRDVLELTGVIGVDIDIGNIDRHSLHYAVLVLKIGLTHIVCFEVGINTERGAVGVCPA